MAIPPPPSDSVQSRTGSAQSGPTRVWPFPPRSELLVYADPSEPGRLVVVVNADNVFGSRWLGSDTNELMNFLHQVGANGWENGRCNSYYEMLADVPLAVKEEVVRCRFGGYQSDTEFAVTAIRSWVDCTTTGLCPVIRALPREPRSPRRSFVAASIGGNQRGRERMARVGLVLAMLWGKAWDTEYNPCLSTWDPDPLAPWEIALGFMNSMPQFKVAAEHARDLLYRG